MDRILTLMARTHSEAKIRTWRLKHASLCSIGGPEEVADAKKVIRSRFRCGTFNNANRKAQAWACGVRSSCPSSSKHWNKVCDVGISRLARDDARCWPRLKNEWPIPTNKMTTGPAIYFGII